MTPNKNTKSEELVNKTQIKVLGKNKGGSIGLQLKEWEPAYTEDYYYDELKTMKFDKDTINLKYAEIYPPKK